MKLLRADLHIHTVLSPCGDLDMSPVNIVSEAALKGLDIIGITDHNTTRHCGLINKLASEKGIFVMQGAEITTKEEVHCLAFFENTDVLIKFQYFLDSNLPEILNDPAKFGFQVQVDENEIVVYEEKKLLTNAISKTFEETEAFVHSLNGLFIPAHINRTKNSIYSQLGLLPDCMKADALEISALTTTGKFAETHPEIMTFPVIRSSDAHLIADIGSASTIFYINEATFAEIELAFKGENGHKSNNRMKELSLNILDIVQNSIRAKSDEITIEIRESVRDDIFRITITDNGTGIPGEILTNVTDPFVTTRTKRRMGLGLPLLKYHAELAGGKLEIVSESGSGTEITADFSFRHFDRQPLGDMAEVSF